MSINFNNSENNKYNNSTSFCIKDDIHPEQSTGTSTSSAVQMSSDTDKVINTALEALNQLKESKTEDDIVWFEFCFKDRIKKVPSEAREKLEAQFKAVKEVMALRKLPELVAKLQTVESFEQLIDLESQFEKLSKDVNLENKDQQEKFSEEFSEALREKVISLTDQELKNLVSPANLLEVKCLLDIKMIKDRLKKSYDELIKKIDRLSNPKTKDFLLKSIQSRFKPLEEKLGFQKSNINWNTYLQIKGLFRCLNSGHFSNCEVNKSIFQAYLKNISDRALKQKLTEEFTKLNSIIELEQKVVRSAFKLKELVIEVESAHPQIEMNEWEITRDAFWEIEKLFDKMEFNNPEDRACCKDNFKKIYLCLRLEISPDFIKQRLSEEHAELSEKVMQVLLPEKKGAHSLKLSSRELQALENQISKWFVKYNEIIMSIPEEERARITIQKAACQFNEALIAFQRAVIEMCIQCLHDEVNSGQYTSPFVEELKKCAESHIQSLPIFKSQDLILKFQAALNTLSLRIAEDLLNELLLCNNPRDYYSLERPLFEVICSVSDPEIKNALQLKFSTIVLEKYRDLIAKKLRELNFAVPTSLAEIEEANRKLAPYPGRFIESINLPFSKEFETIIVDEVKTIFHVMAQELGDKKREINRKAITNIETLLNYLEKKSPEERVSFKDNLNNLFNQWITDVSDTLTKQILKGRFLDLYITIERDQKTIKCIKQLKELFSKIKSVELNQLSSDELKVIENQLTRWVERYHIIRAITPEQQGHISCDWGKMGEEFNEILAEFKCNLIKKCIELIQKEVAEGRFDSELMQELKRCVAANMESVPNSATLRKAYEETLATADARELINLVATISLHQIYSCEVRFNQVINRIHDSQIREGLIKEFNESVKTRRGT